MVINSEIDLYNKKLEKGKLLERDTHILLENVKKNTKELNILLETFLFLSRIENKIEKLNKRKINFSKYLETLSKTYVENYFL
jgi:signal transduction histidine kinase